MKGRLNRLLYWCINWAQIPFPVPVSPINNTDKSEFATLSRALLRLRKTGWCPIKLLTEYFWRRFSCRFSFIILIPVTDRIFLLEIQYKWFVCRANDNPQKFSLWMGIRFSLIYLIHPKKLKIELSMLPSWAETNSHIIEIVVYAYQIWLKY